MLFIPTACTYIDYRSSDLEAELTSKRSTRERNTQCGN